MYVFKIQCLFYVHLKAFYQVKNPTKNYYNIKNNDQETEIPLLTKIL